MPRRRRSRAFTILEVMATLTILAVILNFIFVCYLRAERANGYAAESVHRLLIAQTTLEHIQRTVRNGQGLLAAHENWTSDAGTLVVRNSEGRAVVFTRDGADLLESDPTRADRAPRLRHPLHALDIRFDYGGRPPAEAQFVTCTFALERTWPDTADWLTLRTGAAVRAPKEKGP